MFSFAGIPNELSPFRLLDFPAGMGVHVQLVLGFAGTEENEDEYENDEEDNNRPLGLYS